MIGNQQQIAESLKEKLQRLIHESGHRSLEDWCTNNITQFTKPLEYAIYLDEKIIKMDLSESDQQKDMNSIQSQELLEAKISFLKRLYDKKNSLLLDPVEKNEDLHLLIDVSKEDIKHYEQKTVTKKVPQLKDNLYNLNLMLQIHEITEKLKPVPIIGHKKNEVIDNQCKDYMHQAKQMPECFEKTLVRIIYMMSLLNQESQDQSQKVEDQVLDINTKESRLQKLRTDLKNIESLMNLEKIDDTAVEFLIKETVEYFKTTQDINPNFSQYLNLLLISLVKNVRPFNFQEFFDLVSICDTNSERIEGKSIILIQGTTGAGKSTFIQYTYGAQMTQFPNHIQADPMPEKIQSFISSSAMRSITRYINPLDFEFQNEDGDQELITIVDTPGYGDSQGVEVDISNTLGIIKSVSKANKVYPVFIFSERNFGGRGEIFKSQIEFYSCMIKNMNENKKSLNFFFSHFADKQKNMELFMNEIIKDLNPVEHNKLLLKEILNHMKKLGQEKKLRILDPLDKKYLEVLHQIMATTPISNPKNNFNLNILERSRTFLDKQVNLHEKAIMLAVERGDTEIAKWKINELVKLAHIFSNFENIYQQKLQQIINRIKEFVKKITEDVLERIQTCMKDGNQLYDTDISKFQEALAFERKISPLIESISQLSRKSSDQKVFCDQQSPMVSAVISQCEICLTLLNNNHDINEDQWINFIQKTMNLSKNIKGFEQLEKNSLDKYTAKFMKISLKAEKIINEIDINSETTDLQSQGKRDEIKKSTQTQNLNLRKKSSYKDDDEDLKTDNDMKAFEFDISSNQMKKIDQNFLSSSDLEELNQAQDEINKNNQAEFEIKKLKFYKQKMEGIANNKSLKHKKFAKYTAFLLQGFNKIKVINKQDFISNLQNHINDLYSKVQQLEDKIQANFQFHYHDGRNGFRLIDQNDIIKIKQSLTMIENFHIVCKVLDEKLGEIIGKISETFITKCQLLFDHHFKFLIEVFQRSDAKSTSATDAQQHFQQILLLRQISQIENKTNGPYHSIIVQIQNKIQFSKNEIISIMQEFNDYSCAESSNQSKRALNNLFKRLKEALHFTRILSKIVPDSNSFMKNIFNDIQTSFENLITRLEYDAGQYMNLGIEHPRNLQPVANIFEQLHEIYICAGILEIKDQIKQNVGNQWITAIKDTLLQIEEFSINIQGKLMMQGDYRKYELSSEYLKQLGGGDGVIPSQSISTVLDQINSIESSKKLEQNPRQIWLKMKDELSKQFKLQIDEFNQAFEELISNTNIIQNEENKTPNPENLKIQVSQKEIDLKHIADRIIKIFKLASDVKIRYPQILKQILEGNDENNEYHFQITYTNEINSKFFNNFKRNQISIKNRPWIYINFQAMKYLKEIDAYLYPSQQIAQNSYQILDEYYYHDTKQEVQNAQLLFKSNNFVSVHEKLQELSIPPIQTNAQTTIDKIIDYINEQAKDSFDQMSQFICDDLSLNQNKARIIAEQTDRLMKMNVKLSDRILIRGQTIETLVQTRVFSHLQKCFDHFYQKVENYIQRMNIVFALLKIEKSRSLFLIIQQTCGPDVRERAEYTKLQETSQKISKKRESLKKAINKLIEEFAQRDIYKAGDLPHANKFYNDLEKAKGLNDFSEKQEELVSRLTQKYLAEKIQIEKSLKETEEIEDLQKIERKVKMLIETLIFMPPPVDQPIKLQLNTLETSQNLQVQQQEEKQNQIAQATMASSQDPKQLADLLKKNSKLIKFDNLQIIRQNIQQQFKGIFTFIQEQMNKNRIQDVITVLIPKLKEYINELSVHLGPDQIMEYSKILTNINEKFKVSIETLFGLFIETHSPLTGMRIQSSDENNCNKLLDLTADLNIISDIIASRQTHQELVEKECVPDLERILNKFFIQALEYLRNLKVQWQNGLKNKVIQESIAAINNLKQTNNLLINRLFKEIISDQSDLCKSLRREIDEELKQVKLEKMQNDVIEHLSILKNQIDDVKVKFIDKLRSEADRTDFYKTIQANIEVLNIAQQTESCCIQNKQVSRISQLFFEARNHCEDKITELVANVSNFCKKIDDGEIIEKEQFEAFGVLYVSLKSLHQHLSISRNVVENAINDFEGALTRKLYQQKRTAKEYYADQFITPKTRELAKVLCHIQQMRENMTLFEEKILNVLDQIIEDYSQLRSKDSQAAINLQNELKLLPGGGHLSQTHSYFKGVNNLAANQLFQTKKIDEVLIEIKGTDLGEGEKRQLEMFYKQFLEQYTAIIDDRLLPRRNESGERIPIDISGIKSDIKNKLSSETSKKWLNSDIFGDVKIGGGQNNPIREKKKLAILLANIFALWTLMNSDHYMKAEEMDGAQTNLKGYLLQPHVAQILSILRILGVGFSTQEEKGSFFNKLWDKVFGSSSDVRNNLVQIKTGEGKSITLAVVSIVFALNGFEVKCACYSKNLSMRDFEAFEPMFRALGLQDLIKYGTFNEIAEYQINRDSDVRELLKSLVLKDEFQTSQPNIDLRTEKRPQVLLIDEVDVFFSNEFFGNTYNPQAQIQNEAVSALTDYIWQQRQLKVQEIAKMSEDQKEQEKNKTPYISIKALKDTDVYKNALNIFKPEYQFLVEEAAKKMVVDVVEFESPGHRYVMQDGLIGYVNQDQISTNARVGYQTLFAYYYKNMLKEVNDETLESKKAIGIDCASFSYAEVPLEYQIILGVTGTLETLSKPQNEIITQVYSIHNQTFSPSVHARPEEQIFDPREDVQIIKDDTQYYRHIVNEIKSKYLIKNRPVILFFENNQELNKFANSEEFIGNKYQIINERANNKEKSILVMRATQAKTITLSTKNFGRGTDFRCFDMDIITAGGLVVIQTFLSEDLSEEIQIRGRTGRQGTSGKYLLILNLKDLSKFNIEAEDIDSSNLKKYDMLCEFRNRKIEQNQHETTKNRLQLKVIHDQSNNIIKQVKHAVGNKVQMKQTELKQLTDYLLEMNKGVNFETEFQVMKVLVLIDCTGSMDKTLQKTKNCVTQMFEEARKALRDMKLSEDLILMKIGGYRNYSSLEEQLFQASPEWTSNPNNLTSFLNDTLKVQGGQGREAIEIGLQFANKEIKNNSGVPVSMIIIIGDAAPNTVDDVKTKRKEVAFKNPKYWETTQDYKKPTHWKAEIEGIKAAKVPVHTFYVLNEKIQPQKQDIVKEFLKNEFQQLSVNDGKCAFLDIHDEAKGQEQLKEFFKYLIVYRATEINLSAEDAKAAVKNFKVSFT